MFSVLYCIVLCCDVVYCMLYFIVLCCIALSGIVLYRAVWHCVGGCCVLLYCVVSCCVVLYVIILCKIKMLYSIAL